MAVHRLNYTGRRRIDQHRVFIQLEDTENGGLPTFTAKFDISDMHFPPDAALVVTAQRDRTAMRFPWGTVETPSPPGDCRLIDVPVNPYFRLIVLDPDGTGRLLGLADQIRPIRANRSESLLWLEEKDLGQEVWRLDFPEGDGSNPTLQVNGNISGISTLARQDDSFLASLLPEVLRSILARALLVEEVDPTDVDEQTPWGRWMAFVQGFFAEDYPEIGEDGSRDRAALADWIDDAVAAFARDRFPAKDKFAAARRD